METRWNIVYRLIVNNISNNLKKEEIGISIILSSVIILMTLSIYRITDNDIDSHNPDLSD